MQATIPTTVTSKPMLWTGRILTALAALFLLFDSVTHMMQIAPVVEAMNQLGYPAHLALSLGIIQLICLLLYLIPSTSLLGAVLLTAYLGGAVATNLRIGAPLFSNVLFPVYLGLFIWGGLYLRDERLRALFPLRK
jgi:hypothetical protein